MNNPLVSIIIPTYNRAHFLGETLDSVIAQTYQNWECIVVDDGSSDYTQELMEFFCQKDTRIRYHHRPDNKPKGANACRNYGYELSKGEYINWFDSDDKMLDFFIQFKIREFDLDTDFVICNGYFVDEYLKDFRLMNLKAEIDLFREIIMWHQNIITNSILFDRTFLKNKELFNESIRRGQETELFSRLFFKISRNQFKIVTDPLFLYRQHLETKSSKNRIYMKDYRESQVFIAIRNFEYSIILKDTELINYSYNLLIKYFFQGIANNHLQVILRIYLRLSKYLISQNLLKGLDFIFIGCFFLIMRRGSYKVKRRWEEFLV